jgi:UDP-N-acetylglucosamine 2-epimerase (non-hydrolysing)
MKILLVVGARPNFMKIAPIVRVLEQHPDRFELLLVHTGQHYDDNMSRVFFEELELPRPDINLEVGSGSHAWQTGEIMQCFESVLLDYAPDWVLVPGDVNSTLACTLVASKLGFPVAHIEAGLRSFDRTMPEEINRVVTDQLADLLFTPSRDADENLRREGIPPEKICFVGNVMIDTLAHLQVKAKTRWTQLKPRFDWESFCLVTLHRPANVDDPNTLAEIMVALAEISQQLPIIFPVHPRTRQRLSELTIPIPKTNFLLTEPLGYLDFLALEMQANLVITDSGGVQEETTYLGVPCLTVRQNTERPITITHGTNQLVESKHEKIVQAANDKIRFPEREKREIEFWDGRAAERIVQAIFETSGKSIG